MYSQALKYQSSLSELQKQNFGKMTFQEKKLNRDDLSAYKNNEPQVKSLIPGLSNFQTNGPHLKRTQGREQEVPGKMRLSQSVGILPHYNEQNSDNGFSMP
mmetsp:Transcript_38318/g.36667  ORF Transcript_38318/g.36667 Transcript_38318/m.36667 type:complete len:101 (+) Transcript_38318:1015-1317(+)